MTETVLIEVNGLEATERLLADDPQTIHKRLRPHAETHAPPPPGIFPAFPDPDEAAGPALPPSHAALASAFHMPSSEEQ